MSLTTVIANEHPTKEVTNEELIKRGSQPVKIQNEAPKATESKS